MLKIGSHVGMKGKEMMLGSVKEAVSYGANTFMVYTGAPQNTKRKAIAELRIEEAWEYMKALNQNIALYTHSGSKPARMALSGEYPIGISLGYRGHKMLVANQPITMIFADEGYGWDLECLALIQKDSIKPNAQTFIKWASSDEAMKLYAENNALTGIKQNTTPLGYLSNPYENLLAIDFVDFSKQRDRILKTWNTNFDIKSETK